MKIIKKGDLKPRTEEGCLYIAVEGGSPAELSGLDAKKLAWNERFNHGFGTAGIEGWRAPFPIETPKDSKKAATKYAIVFRIVPSL